ncbi:MAG: beta-L-arabinofuranosidase domain-containing protein [Prevotella sp.]
MKQFVCSVLFLLLAFTGNVKAAEEIKPVPFTSVHVSDQFWRQRLDVLQQRTIRYAFQKCTEAGYMENFRLAGQILSGEVKQGDVRYQSGTTYDDAEVYKVIEGASYLLSVAPDKELEDYVDSVIDLICSAQEPDGYVFTNWTIANPLHEWLGGKQWENDWNLSHETFDMGELIEAAVAYYQATGKDKFLKTAIRCADLICEKFNPEGIRESPGHAVVEMALVRLYEVTGDRKYLDECKFFLDCRGAIRSFDPSSLDLRVNGKYWQNHLPAIEQREAVGHAVRAVYFYSGMADWVRYSNDEAYREAIDAIWENIVSKKLYITGGLGARDHDEAFGENYELPNATAYCETCASVAACMFNLRMFRLYGQSKYIDFLERALYNNVLDGLAIQGDHFFYPNRLETSSRGQERSEWFGTSCCPTNLSRLIPSMPGYVYATQGNTLFVNLFVGSTSNIALGDNDITLTQTTDYPWEGRVSIKVDDVENPAFDLKVRIPGWAVGSPVSSDLYTYVNASGTRPVITLNGVAVDYDMVDGYALFSRNWKAGDELVVELPMDVHQVKSHELLTTNNGLLAVERGPLVYCAEFADNNGAVNNLAIPEGASFSVAKEEGTLFSDFRSITATGSKAVSSISNVTIEDASIVLVPYFSRSYRGNGEMKIWMPTSVEAMIEDQASLDQVIVCDDASESEHNLQGEGMRWDKNVGWRDALNGWISYTMKVDPDRPCELVLKHWGSDGGNRQFDIYADGEKFSYDHVDNFMPNQYYEMHHAIPFHLTKGKSEVTFMFKALSDNIVGGLYGVRTILTKEVPENAVVEDYFLPTARNRMYHKYKSNGGSGEARGRIWVDGQGEEGLYFDMAVNGNARNTVMFLYWGDEVDVRNFDILVNGEKIASQTLFHNIPGRYFFQPYPIPEALTEGKEKVTVKLSSPEGTKVGGFVYVYTFSESGTTGIGSASLASAHGDGRRFNLCGQRVDEAYKGIVIVNGRKFVCE